MSSDAKRLAVVDVPPALSVCIATRDRVAGLESLLRSLAEAVAMAGVPIEVIVADNGSADGTPALLDRWTDPAQRRLVLFEAQPGKSHALNRLLAAAGAPLLAFTDDDVEVTPSWLQEIVSFFETHPEYDGAMGRVLIPPSITDPQLLARISLYDTFPFFDAGAAVCDLAELYGCNMALRRRLIDVVGEFNVQLGPGASGWGEDTDLSERALEAGLRLGYMPKAVVYHEVDAARLSPLFFRDYHRRKAQGDFLKDPACARHKNLSRLIDASLRYSWCRLTGDTARAMRAEMRIVRHAELLRLRWRAARNPAGWQDRDKGLGMGRQ